MHLGKTTQLAIYIYMLHALQMSGYVCVYLTIIISLAKDVVFSVALVCLSDL